jgi:hypothetical protein
VDAIKDIPGFAVRLKSFRFIIAYEEIFSDVETKYNALKKVFSTLTKQKRLLCLFEATLAIGNYMNGTTAKGGAYGFKLDIIEKT